MPGRSINVVKTHSLGIEVAKVRLRNMVNDPKTDARFKTGSFDWDDRTKTFTVDVIAYGTTVHSHTHIEADKVTVTSDPIKGFYPVVAGAVYIAEREIEAMLTEALK